VGLALDVLLAQLLLLLAVQRVWDPKWYKGQQQQGQGHMG